jgi:HEPN domain-containing protein
VLDAGEWERWRAAAESSLAAARLLRDHDHHHHACLHAEQAAQQALKGLLHGVGVGAGRQARGHDLVTLGERAATEAGTPLDADLDEALSRLTRHYLPSRYPDALPGGTPAAAYHRSDADEAMRDAEAVLAFAEGAWSALVSAAEDEQR